MQFMLNCVTALFRMIGNVNVNSHCVCLTVCWLNSVAGPVLCANIARSNSPDGFYFTALSDKGIEKNAEDSQKRSTGIY